MSLRKALLGATMLALPLAAQAQPVTGIYIGAGAGPNYRDTSTYTLRPFATRGTAYDNLRVRESSTIGIAGVLSVGYGFGNGLRVEVEGNFRQNDLDKTRLNGQVGLNRNTGYVRQYGGMVNAFYDFSAFQFGLAGIDYIQPYLGAGVGVLFQDYQSDRLRLTNSPQSLLISETGAGQFAYQGIAGIAFPLTAFGITGVTATAEYRYLGSVSDRLSGQVQNVVNGNTIGGERVHPTVDNHAILFGLRYAFNQPAPPVIVQPPVVVQPGPTIARTYLVFFDWNRADLTARARQIIGEAAQNSRTAGVTRIEVAGHADRSGTPAYNLRLSQRRAEVVAAQLVRDGVSRGQIVTQAFGESRPLVPTADGVREPQNRRVEIVLR